MTTEVLSYAIDEQDHLIKVDQGYYRFAEENGWTEAATSLGRSLWDYVAGHEMKKLQRLLVRRIRDEVGDVELPFRCDGPGVRREMNIRIVARPGGRVVLFSAQLRSEEEREAAAAAARPGGAARRRDARDVRLVRPLRGRRRVGGGRGGGAATGALQPPRAPRRQPRHLPGLQRDAAALRP